MKFKDKLPKLRKDNNLSQEQLADRLGVSRQAISKWESGSSYPDMEKMLQICNILNCTLEDLMDDGTIKGKGNVNPKFSLNNCLDDLLKFITKVYNMFCSMKFRQKIKCLLELAMIILMLFAIASLIFVSVLNIFALLPYRLANILRVVFSLIYFPLALILGFIIFLHLFKIRYLDYYITIEDKNVTQKIIEEPIEKTENKKYVEGKKEKIIIRDPKHSTFNFVSGLVRIFALFTKVLALLSYIPLVISFIIIVFSLFVSIYYISYNVMFLFISLGILGLLSICYAFIEAIYKFIISKEQNFKKIFIVIISGLVLFGLGSGLTFVKYMSLDLIDVNEYSDYVVETQYIELKDDTIIMPFPGNGPVKYEIDNSLDNVKIEVYKIGDLKKKVIYHADRLYDEYYIQAYETEFRAIYKLMLEDIKNNKIRDYGESNCKVKIYLSQKNYDKLSKNYYQLYNY